MFILKGEIPLFFHWAVALSLPLCILGNQASFDLEKSLSTTCDQHCYNGVCLNGSCACTKGWSGPQCDHCYGRIRLSENQTQLSDGPLNYSSSSKCTWIIESDKPTNGPLNIRLETFRTECGWDFVYIYDGDGVHGDQLAAFCGDQDPQEISAPSGKALIYFFSDLAMNLDGFNITYEFDKCPYSCSNHGICENQVCKCENGYTGDYCNIEVCTNGIDGQAGPCKNNGKCSQSRCLCDEGFHGDYCQETSNTLVWDEMIPPTSPTARASHASFLVDDNIWTIGGEHFSGELTDNVVTFNTKSRTWTKILVEGDSPPERYDHSVVRFKNKLYMYGGVIDRKTISGELWSFDLQTRKWQLETGAGDNPAIAPLAASGHTAHVIGPEMFVFFGYHPRIGFIYQVQIYNFETRQWRFGNSRDHVPGRFRHASVQYETEQEGNVVLVYGGSMWSNQQSNNLTDSLMQYSVKQERWIHLPASGIQTAFHTANVINGHMVVVGGTAYNLSSSRTKQECFSNAVLIYDIACKQWYNATQAPAGLKRYGHSAIATENEIFVFGGFNGKMLKDVFKFSPAQCAPAKAEECRSIFDAVKCVYHEGSCQKMDPFVSYKSSFLSFIKTNNPKFTLECRNNPLRQVLQSCEEQKDCTSCTSQSECGWCASGEQCLQRENECVDGQMILTSYSKCPANLQSPPPRPCSMSTDCQSCKLLSHCNWFSVDNKNICISLEEQEVLLAEQHSRELEKLSTNTLPLRHTSLATPSLLQNTTTCSPACAEIIDCGDCISNTRCMWCPTTVRCINMEAYTLSFAYGQCHSWLTGNSPGGYIKSCAQESSNCSSHKTCSECQLSPHCGWLDDGSRTGLGGCVRGTKTGPLDGNPKNERWYFLSCPECQCNGHSKCNSTLAGFLSTLEVCASCANNTTGNHCETCAPGFYGDPRNGGTCSPCECHGQADECDPRTGYCHCRTKGVIGKYCDKCDHKYYGTPANGTPCYYELAVDFIFTFKLKKEDKDKHVTDIYLFSIPYKKDTDVTFQISCEPSAYVALSETTSYLPNHAPRNRTLMTRTHCDHRGFRRIYSASDSDGWSFGNDHNTTFFVRVYNFTTPITIQVSFAQSPPINWVLFFVIFAACFIVLLVVAGLLWMIKLRIEVYRRNQRRIDEIEHMASRPFANVKLELSTPYTAITHSPTPLSIEPCGNYKAGVFTLAVRLPTGGRATTPNGTSGLAVASALCLLTPAQLGVLQAPDNADSKNNRKTNMRRYIPFLRGRQVENA